jgi:hypothetical protein
VSINAAIKLDNGNIRTPKGRILYPSLFKPSLPKGETNEDKAKYGATLLIPKDSDITALKNAIQETLEESFSAKVRAASKIKMPILKTEDFPRFAEYADDFPWMIRCNANYRPEVVGPTRDPIAEEDEADEVYGGRWAKLSVNAYSWDHPTGGKGISLGLQNVQLLKHDDAIAGGRVKAAQEFEDEDVGDMNDGMDL